MAKLSVVKGTTSLSAYIFISDSSVTTGAGKTGLAFNTASLVAYYVRPRAAPVAITLATLAAVTTAYTSGGFIEIDATNMPGIYRVDIPDAALATGVNAVVVMLKGAANMVPVALEIELTGVDNQNATTFGLSNLDAAITSRLAPTVAARTLDVSAAGEAGIDWANIGSPTTAVNLSGTNIDVDQVVASVSGAVGSVAAGGITAASIATDAIDNDAIAANAVTEIQSGLATGAALTTAQTDITSIKAKTDLIPASPAAVGSAMTLSNAGIDAIFDRTDGVETGYTLRQALRLMAAALAGELSGAATTTITIRNITDTKARITATVDADGNRTAVTHDVS